MNQKIKTVIVPALLIVLTGPIFADIHNGYLDLLTPRQVDFPENYTVRKDKSYLLTENYYAVRSSPQSVEENALIDGRVKIRIDEQNNHFYISFINELDYSFPRYSQGTYIVKRRVGDSQIVQVKVFLHSDPESVIRMVPFGDRVSLSLTLYGHTLYRDVLLPLSMEQAAHVPFSRVVELTDRIIDWKMIFPEEHSYDNRIIFTMVREIRNAMGLLRDSEDGAQDREGNFVFIETLGPQDPGGFNCSGFAKWVVDGLYYPLAGEYTDIPQLKEMHKEYRGNRWSDSLEEDRDPYFGLDWTRNLARQLHHARFGDRDIPVEFSDVEDIPFFSYTEDVGFSVSDLKIILYMLAITEPGYFYLGSVSNQPGAENPIRQHYHVAVFFPFYSEERGFSVALFERNFETDLKSFISRYSGEGISENIHLVRVPLLEDFQLPLLNIQNE